jgi:phosphoribosylformimino-5-aminoimidazole carboxamide ribotide isomerase
MIVTPAVDIRAGSCVQLVGGSYEHEVVSAGNPVAAAKRWVSEGFGLLHVVDLDAATGRGENTDAVRTILEMDDLEIQVGGGMRTTDRVSAMLDAGAARVVVGTRAFEDREWLESIVAANPGRIVVAADVRGRKVVTHGWQNTLDRDIDVEIAGLNDLPLAGLLVTAVHVEGLMQGADVALISEVVRLSTCPVQASGGIANIADLRAIETAGAAQAIIGMALYTGALSASDITREFTQ